MVSDVAAKSPDDMTCADDVLLAIQSRLKVPKSENNEYGGYTYRSLEAINQAVKPIAAEYDSYVTYLDEVVLIGQRYYVKATCTLVTPFHDIASIAYAREAEMRKGMDAAQITGAASSYARKYAAQGLFALDGESDPDSLPPEPTRYNVKCRQCGRQGRGFLVEEVHHAQCDVCGAIDWEIVR